MAESAENEILNLLGVGLGGLSYADLVDGLGQLGVRRVATFKHTVQTLGSVLRPMESAGQIVIDGSVRAADGTHDRICRRLLDRGRFAEVSRIVTDVATGSGYGHRLQRGPDLSALRDIRIELYTGSATKVLKRAAAIRAGWDPTVAHTPPLTAAIVPPARLDWLESLPPEVADALALEQVQRRLTERPIGMIMEWVESRAARPDAPQDLRFEWAQHLILKGDFDTAEPLLAHMEGAHATFELGRLSMLRGRRRAALKTWTEAHKDLKRTSRKAKIQFPGVQGLLWPMALLSTADPASIRKATEQIELGVAAGDIPHYLGLVVTAGAAGLLGTPPRPMSAERYLDASPDPLSCLTAQLIALLLGEPAEPPVQARIVEHARAAAAAELWWLSRELWDVYARTGGAEEPIPELAARLAKVPGKPLGAQFAGRPEWERRFAALAALKPSRASGGQREMWVLERTPSGVDLSLLVQRKSQTGWLTGTPVALKRLKNPLRLGWLSKQGLAVAACLREEKVGWGGDAELQYTLKQPEALAALVGHPNLLDGASNPLTLRLATPRVVVEDGEEDIVLSLQPTPPTSGHALLDIGPGEVALLDYSKHDSDLVEILKTPLVVPSSEREKVTTVLEVLSELVPVSSDLLPDQNTTKPSDARPVLQIRKVGDTIIVRPRVRPLGPSGPVLRPGEGAETVFATIDDLPVQAERDLDVELAALHALVKERPRLEGLQAGELTVDDLEESLELVLSLADLQDEGRLEWEHGKPLRIVVGGAPRIAVGAANGWFSATGSVGLDDDEIAELAELLAGTPAGRFVALADGRYVALTDALARGLETLRRFGEVRAKGVRFHPMALPMLTPMLDEASGRRTPGLKQLQDRMSSADSADPQVPANLKAELRDYQKSGFEWLARLSSWGAGACLADDMGLGKTVQALALLLHRADDGPALVVAPTSVGFNWMDEAARFGPSLTVHLFGPGDREAQIAALGPGDILVCSYGLLQREAEALASRRWSTVVLDEAQAIKNSTTLRARAAFGLEADFRLATTGTPVENRLEELWSLFQFLLPNFLGSKKRFGERFGAGEGIVDLRKMVRPFILRRLKSEVLDTLPPRTDIVWHIEPGEEEASIYEALRRAAAKELEGAAESPQQRMQVLSWITKLRLACCDPRLVHEDAGPGAKRAELQRLVGELRAGGHKALIFSQFVKHLSLTREWLDEAKIPYQYLDGSTPAAERRKRVKAFQAGEGDVFLISLKAGGTGLNLTAANYVIHLDPWWNPAVEDQASDRAHRIGQTRAVTVYRLVSRDTIEDRILQLHDSKRALASELLAGTNTTPTLNASDLLALITH
jgi:superfamily II DNA or RNA helicase